MRPLLEILCDPAETNLCKHNQKTLSHRKSFTRLVFFYLSFIFIEFLQMIENTLYKALLLNIIYSVVTLFISKKYLLPKKLVFRNLPLSKCIYIMV